VTLKILNIVVNRCFTKLHVDRECSG